MIVVIQALTTIVAIARGERAEQRRRDEPAEDRNRDRVQDLAPRLARAQHVEVVVEGPMLAVYVTDAKHVALALNDATGRAVIQDSGRTATVPLAPADGRARPLVIVGHYEPTSGGCDTIPKYQEEVFAIASRYAGRGWNVFLEGNELSREYRKSLDLAGRHPLHILQLITPVEECVRRLAKRRGLRRQHLARVYDQLEEEARSIRQACKILGSVARVEQLEFDQGIARAEKLLNTPIITAQTAA